MAVVVSFVPSPYGRGQGRGGSNKIPQQVRDDVWELTNVKSIVLPLAVRDDVSLSLRGECEAFDVVIPLNFNDFEITSVLLLHVSISRLCDCHGLASLGLAMTAPMSSVLSCLSCSLAINGVAVFAFAKTSSLCSLTLLAVQDDV